MTRDEFDARAAAVIRRNYRHMDDLGGQPPAALLDGLFALAEQHAAEADRDNLREWREGPGTSELAAKEAAAMALLATPPDLTGVTPAPKPAPRRTTRRSTPK